MIESWTLEHFKSVDERSEFSLRPLTVLVGANSSGKSTLIQSMLMVAQTVTNQTPARHVVLNGHVARLGSFSDIVTAGLSRDDARISVGFTLTAAKERSGQRPAYLHDGIDRVSLEFSFEPDRFGPSQELQELHPRLHSCRVRIENSEAAGPTQIRIERNPVPPEQRLSELGVDQKSLDRDMADALRYVSTIDGAFPLARRRYYHMSSPRDARAVGVTMRHFLPYGEAVAFDLTRARGEAAVRQLTGLAEDYLPFELDDDFMGPGLVEKIGEIAERTLTQLLSAAANRQAGFKPSRNAIVSALLAQIRSARTPKDLFVAHRHHRPSPELRAAYEEAFDELVSVATSGQPASPTVQYRPLIPELFYFVHETFAERFRYLGPLRDEPKAVYPLEGTVETSHVGLKGEFTAAVLDVHRATQVAYCSPSEVLEHNLSAPIRRASLSRAVGEWLQYLGVVERVETRDRGVFGHELIVATERGGELHNLVHVGVGVSQVLPILVMSLLSEPGSVLVLEQPELHLHPGVQTLLGDFLISLVASGRQCIVETHSEYLVNRLRYQAAADPEDTIHTRLALYFVEKVDRRSRYRLIDVNEYGAIGDWPSGFFDQSPAEMERILGAAMAKRRARRQEGRS